MRKGYPRMSGERLHSVAGHNGGAASAIADALINGLEAPETRRAATITTCMRPLPDWLTTASSMKDSAPRRDSEMLYSGRKRRPASQAASAATCTIFQILQKLGLKTYVPDAGSWLSGRYRLNTVRSPH